MREKGISDFNDRGNSLPRELSPTGTLSHELSLALYTLWKQTECMCLWQELDFVMDPYGFKHSDNKDWQEQDPEEWTPKHEYGGHRTPIRLEVLYMYLRTHVRAYVCL